MVTHTFPQPHDRAPRAYMVNIELGTRKRCVFSDEQIRAIRADKRSYRALGQTYGVSTATISYIKRGYSYRHVWLTEGRGKLNETEIAEIVERNRNNPDVVRLFAHIEAQRIEILAARNETATIRRANGVQVHNEKDR